MRTPQLDKRVILLRPVAAQDGSGRPTVTWFYVAEISAQILNQSLSRGEEIAEGMNVSRRPSRITIRWRDGVSADMRIKHGERTMRIVTEPIEIGRRAWLEFVAEELSVEGQDA